MFIEVFNIMFNKLVDNIFGLFFFFGGLFFFFNGMLMFGFFRRS